MSGAFPDTITDFPVAQIPFPVGSDRLIGVSLTRKRNLGLVLGGAGIETLQLVLQALHLALALEVERVLWCSGLNAADRTQVEPTWDLLTADFPGRVSRYDDSVAGYPCLDERHFKSGTVLLMDEGFIAAGGGLVEAPEDVVSIRLVSAGAPNADSVSETVSFMLSPWPGQQGLVTRYLLTLPNQPGHFVDFERWQGWLTIAVRKCREQRSASIRFVEERWGGQRALCLGDQLP
ncbi:hypothetical protein PsaNZ64_00865 [Pseudomonas syringae pv. actinidiae]|uniref:hypothetical protein n=1 Tax=Pseudomonas syringae group TaxID=136849 RepID=UPI0006B98BAA|nr:MULTISPECIES: hypothetical protein [Pseudomonas syringae group]OKS78865.1 hypothetical protein PsaNZ64_00865 [Pseudomonas syringae pv. actinidiae]